MNTRYHRLKPNSRTFTLPKDNAIIISIQQVWNKLRPIFGKGTRTSPNSLQAQKPPWIALGLFVLAIISYGAFYLCAKNGGAGYGCFLFIFLMIGFFIASLIVFISYLRQRTKTRIGHTVMTGVRAVLIVLVILVVFAFFLL